MSRDAKPAKPREHMQPALVRFRASRLERGSRSRTASGESWATRTHRELSGVVDQHASEQHETQGQLRGPRKRRPTHESSEETGGRIGQDQRRTFTLRPPRPYHRFTPTCVNQNRQASNHSPQLCFWPAGLGGSHMATPRTLSSPSSLAT